MRCVEQTNTKKQKKECIIIVNIFYYTRNVLYLHYQLLNAVKRFSTSRNSSVYTPKGMENYM